jgi:hypothetical protein
VRRFGESTLCVSFHSTPGQPAAQPDKPRYSTCFACPVTAFIGGASDLDLTVDLGWAQLYARLKRFREM